MAAEHGILPHCRRVLLVEDLAFPTAVLRSVGTEIIEEGVAAEDAAVVEQHHAGEAPLDTVKHPDVNGIEAVDDAALTEATGDRDRFLLDRRHDGLERHARQLLQLALEAIEFTIRLAAGQQRCIVGAGHRPVVRIGIMPNGIDLDRDLVADLLVGADMGEGRIATQHPAVARVHHAAADRIAKLEPDLVKASECHPYPRHATFEF